MSEQEPSVLEERPRPFAEVTPITTKGRSNGRFTYTVAPRGRRVILLTTGFTACIGEWYGEYGEYFIGWYPMPDRDKELEKAKGLSWINLIRRAVTPLLPK